MPGIEISDELRSSFHLFWDNFPFPVMLVRKDRTIVDRNPASAATGCAIGTRCIDRGAKEAHRGCLANHALREGTGKHSVQAMPSTGTVVDAFWVPLLGSDDLYVHFSVNITEVAAPHLLAAAQGA